MIWNLFDQLVIHDPAICGNEETPLEKEIQALVKNPDPYAIPGISRDIRNANLVQVKVEDQQIVRVVMAKAGRLGRPIYEKIRNVGNTLADLLEILKETPEEQLQNLPAIAARKKTLTLPSYFHVVLAVPRGAYDDDAINLINRHEFRHQPGEYMQFLDILGNCNIMESPFSRKELDEMTSCTIETLKNYPI